MAARRIHQSHSNQTLHKYSVWRVNSLIPPQIVKEDHLWTPNSGPPFHPIDIQCEGFHAGLKANGIAKIYLRLVYLLIFAPFFKSLPTDIADYISDFLIRDFRRFPLSRNECWKDPGRFPPVISCYWSGHRKTYPFCFPFYYHSFPWIPFKKLLQNRASIQLQLSVMSKVWQRSYQFYHFLVNNISALHTEFTNINKTKLDYLIWSKIDPFKAFGHSVHLLRDLLDYQKFKLEPDEIPVFMNDFDGKTLYHIAALRFIIRFLSGLYFFHIPELLNFGNESQQFSNRWDKQIEFAEEYDRFRSWNFNNIYHRIRNKFDNISKTDEKIISVHFIEVDFIQNAFKEVRFPFERNDF